MHMSLVFFLFVCFFGHKSSKGCLKLDFLPHLKNFWKPAHTIQPWGTVASVVDTSLLWTTTLTKKKTTAHWNYICCNVWISRAGIAITPIELMQNATESPRLVTDYIQRNNKSIQLGWPIGTYGLTFFLRDFSYTACFYIILTAARMTQTLLTNHSNFTECDQLHSLNDISSPQTFSAFCGAAAWVKNGLLGFLVTDLDHRKGSHLMVNIFYTQQNITY